MVSKSFIAFFILFDCSWPINLFSTDLIFSIWENLASASWTLFSPIEETPASIANDTCSADLVFVTATSLIVWLGFPFFLI